MSWTPNFGWLSPLSPWSVLLMTAFACGGGDPSPTAPAGDNATQLRLVSLGRAGLPADVEVEDCTLTRFYSGSIQIDPAGDWHLKLKVHDKNYGDWSYHDDGQTEVDGETLWFDSQISGNSFEATEDNTGIAIMYDWCENGVADVQLVFGR
jgi:hypothetical protein